MQRFTNSVIKVRKNRFSETNTIFQSVPITSLNFLNSLNSINIKEDFFTNYVNSPQKKIYKCVDELYKKRDNNNNEFFKDFDFDELYYNREAADRLIDIINISNSSTYSKEDLEKIYKLKYKKDKCLHMYISIDSGNAEILLIDLYHLSLPSDLIQNHRVVKRGSLKQTKKLYSKYENCTYNLNNIL